jgi:hypothetical protein
MLRLWTNGSSAVHYGKPCLIPHDGELFYDHDDDLRYLEISR